jgi:hypothetical protein
MGLIALGAAYALGRRRGRKSRNADEVTWPCASLDEATATLSGVLIARYGNHGPITESQFLEAAADVSNLCQPDVGAALTLIARRQIEKARAQ